MIADDVYDLLLPEDGLKQNFPVVFKNSIKINVRNVSDYYYDNPKEHWLVNDYPNVAPPWEMFWMEWRTSHIMFTDNPHPTVFKYSKYEKLPDGVYKVWRHPERRAVMVKVSKPDWTYKFGAQWLYQVRFFNCEVPGAYIFEAFFMVDKDGQRCAIPSTDENIALIKSCLPEFANSMQQKANPGMFIIPHHLSNLMANFHRQLGETPFDASVLDVMWLALSFCHCKNVAVKKQVLPDKLKAKRDKREKLPFDSYHTIEINPMKKVLEDSAPSGTSLQRRLHIARGHFKDFREGTGLFGKNHGIYFWPQTMRGSAQLGKVTPSYWVKP